MFAFFFSAINIEMKLDTHKKSSTCVKSSKPLIRRTTFVDLTFLLVESSRVEASASASGVEWGERDGPSVGLPLVKQFT